VARPEIKYCTTEDGVSIAYYAMGEGPTLVIASAVLWSNVRHAQPPVPEYHRFGEGIGRGMRVVRYDSRGTGMSDRAVLDFSLEARLRDLEAVAKKLDLDRFAILGVTYGCFAAIEYAAREPDKVSHLALINPMVNGPDIRSRMRRWDSFRDMASHEWEDYTMTMAAANIGYERPERIKALAERFREAMGPAAVQASFASLNDIDVSDRLSQLNMPALVMFMGHAGGLLTLEEIRGVSATIPNSQFHVTASDQMSFWTGDDIAVVEQFLGVEPSPTEQVAPIPRRASTAIVLFTDIADSTALTERLGDVAFRRKARALDEALRKAVRDHGGTVIDAKTLGDGILATFPAASQAVGAALACSAAGDVHNLPLHVGLHAGDVIRERDNVFGGAVNIAARISALAPPGEVLVSDTVRSLARTSAGVMFEDRGEHELKGIAEAQRVFAVRRQ
jgi:class 3 adenylate cyclase